LLEASLVELFVIDELEEFRRGVELVAQPAEADNVTTCLVEQLFGIDEL